MVFAVVNIWVVQLPDAVAGSIGTILGGFFATVALRWLDRRRDHAAAERRFHAAVLLVLDELQANIETLRITTQHDPDHVPVLLDATYSEHQVDLAVKLPAELRELLARSYRPVKMPRVLTQTVTATNYATMTRQELVSANLPIARGVLEMTEDARARLETFAITRWKGRRNPRRVASLAKLLPGSLPSDSDGVA